LTYLAKYFPGIRIALTMVFSRLLWKREALL